MIFLDVRSSQISMGRKRKLACQPLNCLSIHWLFVIGEMEVLLKCLLISNLWNFHCIYPFLSQKPMVKQHFFPSRRSSEQFGGLHQAIAVLILSQGRPLPEILVQKGNQWRKNPHFEWLKYDEHSWNMMVNTNIKVVLSGWNRLNYDNLSRSFFAKLFRFSSVT